MEVLVPGQEEASADRGGGYVLQSLSTTRTEKVPRKEGSYVSALAIGPEARTPWILMIALKMTPYVALGKSPTT